MSCTQLYATTLKMVITHSISKLSIPLGNLIVQTDSHTRPLSTVLKLPGCSKSGYDAYICPQRTKKDNQFPGKVPGQGRLLTPSEFCDTLKILRVLAP